MKANRKRISQIVLDKKGGDYADLPARLGGYWLHLSVHDGMRIGLNPPAGIPADVWINAICTSFAARAGLKAAWTCLANMCRWLVGVLNPQPDEGNLLFPDFQLLLDVANYGPLSLWASKPDYGKSLVQTLEAITQASGRLFCTFNGLDFERDIISHGKSVVIDMANLSPPWVRQFFVDLILSQILLARIHRQMRVDGTEVVLILDEADADVSRQADAAFPDGASPIGLCLSLGREFGLMAVIGLRVLGFVSRYVLNSVQNHFVFNLSDQESVIEATKTLLLPRGGENMLPALKPGQVLFRQSQTGWSHTMLGKVDNVPSNRTVKTTPYDTHRYTPSKPLTDLPEVRKALDARIREHKRTQIGQVRKSKQGLPELARNLLDQASLHPFFPVARLWELIGSPSSGGCNSARKALESGKFAAFEMDSISNKKLLLMEILSGGWELLGKSAPVKSGRGGITHTHHCQWIARVGESRSHLVHTEWPVPGTSHPADVAWNRDGSWRVFEVIVGCSENILSHIKACLVESDAVETVTIVTCQQKIRDQVRKNIESQLVMSPLLSRIHHEVIETYMKELWP